MTTIASSATESRPSDAWAAAEESIIEAISSLSRWDAERWAAGHERRNPPVSLVALQAAVMQAAIASGRDDHLERGFKRIERTVARAPWADRRPFDRPIKTMVSETAAAVAELAQQALAAAVLADVLTDHLSPRRLTNLDAAHRTIVTTGSRQQGGEAATESLTERS
ncbi:MAG: hypothetical protein OEV40_26910 [Acidimicrobiia bacterium]|nr:hypothetical protein [Acidimicrobiia bacterium]